MYGPHCVSDWRQDLWGVSRYGAGMRMLLGLAVALVGCSAEFPPPLVDVTADMGAAAHDAEPGLELDQLLVAPTEDSGAASPDASGLDAGEADAADHDARVQAEAVLVAASGSEAGCAPRLITLRWQTAGMYRCAIRSATDDFEFTIPTASLARGELQVEAVEETVYTLHCGGPEGVLRSDVPVHFTLELPPRHSLVGPEVVRAEQRRCAGALGQMQIGDDGLVYGDRETSRKICECAGYMEVEAREDAWPCFLISFGRTLGEWRDGEWLVYSAFARNWCAMSVVCASPVETCADLLYPR